MCVREKDKESRGLMNSRQWDWVFPLWPTPAVHPIISPDTAAALRKELAHYLSLCLPASFLTPSTHPLSAVTDWIESFCSDSISPKNYERPWNILQSSSVFYISNPLYLPILNCNDLHATSLDRVRGCTASVARPFGPVMNGSNYL